MLTAWLCSKDGNKAKVEKNIVSESVRKGTVDSGAKQRKKRKLEEEALKFDICNCPMTDVANHLKVRINVSSVLDGMI